MYDVEDDGTFKKFRHKKENEDYDRQKRVIEIVKNTPEWQRSGGRDHIFVLTGKSSSNKASNSSLSLSCLV